MKELSKTELISRIKYLESTLEEEQKILLEVEKILKDDCYDGKPKSLSDLARETIRKLEVISKAYLAKDEEVIYFKKLVRFYAGDSKAFEHQLKHYEKTTL